MLSSPGGVGVRKIIPPSNNFICYPRWSISCSSLFLPFLRLCRPSTLFNNRHICTPKCVTWRREPKTKQEKEFNRKKFNFSEKTFRFSFWLFYHFFSFFFEGGLHFIASINKRRKLAINWRTCVKYRTQLNLWRIETKKKKRKFKCFFA